MTFANVEAKTTITGFTDTDKALILAAMKTAYEGSATAKTMFDTWIATPANTINIKFVAGAFQAFTNGASGTGRVEIDTSYVTNATYINNTGKAVKDTLLSGLVHELGHGLTGLKDNWRTNDQLKGENVVFVNKMYKELGIDEQNSYVSYDKDGTIVKLGLEYTNKTAIDTSVKTNSNLSATGLISNANSNDLFIGGSNANTFETGGGNDFLHGAGGNDILKGGAGTDTAVYFGNPTDYDIRLQADGSWAVRHARGDKTDGTDKLENIEKIQFKDGATSDLIKKGLDFQTDFALVIDTTGSMGSSIGSVKSSATSLIDALFKDGKTDARIGVVSFKDETNGEPTSAILKFTDQDSFADRKAAALSAINSISVSGGGDLPETAYSGLLAALDGRMGEWRPGAGTMRIALFTDAAAKDSDLIGQVLAYANNIGVSAARTAGLEGANGTLNRFEFKMPAYSGRDEDDGNSDIGPLPYTPGSEPINPAAGTASLEVYTIKTGSTSIDTTGLSDIATATGGKFSTSTSDANLVDTLLDIISLPPDAALVSLVSANPDIEKGLTAAYQVLLKGVPNQSGIEFLMSQALATNFGAGPGVVFNQENIFINLFNNLVQGNADAASAFSSLAGTGSLSDQITSLYNAFVPIGSRKPDGLDFFNRADAVSFYSAAAAERGITSDNGPAIIAAASMLKVFVAANTPGIGDAVNDLFNAVINSTSALPATGDTLIDIEVADGTSGDTGDVPLRSFSALSSTDTPEPYASETDVSELAFASSVSIIGITDIHDGVGAF